ncbi:hypothetical protein BDN71DRAFT_1550108 [Pleurotus eryngii]|uniref:Chloride channel protein n=1 Tax=Pleurotus eryngii TaxID=5323 RepID=A0A9P6DJW1_PLEER|nr:hypothetical protein BDN71DRAFT_1550108 [Pleurotus eryngii]
MPDTDSRRPAPGPYDPPTTTTTRRERLMRIGSTSAVPQLHADSVVPDFIDAAHDEQMALHCEQNKPTSYGTLPSSPVRRLWNKPTLNFRSRRQLPNKNIPRLDLSRRSASASASHTPLHSPSASIRNFTISRLTLQRPISAYDAQLQDPKRSPADEGAELDAKINGIRVWYSSFTSIDWLHDAIKDSVRFARLRRRRGSVRSRIRLIFDKSVGWIIVTIVGFLTAVVAFLVVRSEQWLFDIKEGYCTDSWTKAKRFCCPGTDNAFHLQPEEDCPSWRTWSDALGQHGSDDDAGVEFVQYLVYAFVALLLAITSSLLTIYLTNSTTFVTRKESGVLAPQFAEDKSSASPNVPAIKRKVLYYAAGSGIPEIKTILSGFVIHGYLGGRTLFTKSVGLALSVASGLSLGKEGPFVHIASCIGNIVSRFHSKYENNEAKRREILSAACAAGVAVAFGAPIGGTLFSLEEVSYYFPPKVMWRSFFCAMIAAITLKMLDPFGTGKLVLFQVTYDKDWHAYELVPFVLLGIFGGIYGAYFSKLNYRWSKNVRNKTWLGAHPIAEVALVTLSTTWLCFLNPYTRMGGTELVANLFAECRKGSSDYSDLCVLDASTFAQIWPVISAILVALVVKGTLTIITFGIKVPAGIFIPTLGVGACAGRILGIFMQYLQARHPNSRMFAACGGDLDCVVPGLYAMVGAAAALSGVTRTTVSLAVIMFELTDTLTYAVPVMLSVLVAKTMADALEPKGIYDLVIELSQLPYLDAKHEYLWGHLQIGDATDRDVSTIKLDKGNTVKSLRDQLQSLVDSGNDDSGFPILRVDPHENGWRMVGYIGANELEHALSLVADDPDEEVFFHTNYPRYSMASSSLSSLHEVDEREQNMFDFSIYMDQAPLTLTSNSPLEMLQQFFSKLGARYVVITDIDGYYEGVVDKKSWLAFLSDLEERS